MKTLSTEQATALYKWAKENHSKNWGLWFNCPLEGCSFLQFDSNPLVVKFDETTVFGSLKFKRIGWTKRISGKGASTTFFALSLELEKIGVEL